jgi:tetratricopeptide (TPR) repeat protein
LSRRKSTQAVDRQDIHDSTATGRRRSLPRLIAVVLLAVGGALAGAVAISWWQDRPLAEVEARLAAGDPGRALQLVGYYLETRPTHPEALALKARTLVQLQQPIEALELFDQIGAATLEETHAWARAHMLLEQWSEAIPLLNRVLQFDPNHEDALYEITSCRTRLRQFQKGLESAERFRRVTKEKARADLLIASIHFDMANFQPALVAFAAVLEAEPDAANLPVTPADFFLQYGRAYLMNGQPAEALPLLGRSLLLEPDAEAYVLLGNAAEQTGEMDRAIEVWMEALALDPLSVEARESLAQVAIQEGDALAALRWLEPLINSDVRRSSTAYLLQRAYIRLEDMEAAEKWRESAEQFRREEQHQQALSDILITAPESFWGRVVLAHRFASDGNWDQAARILAELESQAREDPFYQALTDAVRSRGELPDLARVPVPQL